MAQKHKQKRASREEWARRVRDWQQSGLSAAEYARAQKLNARTLSWWRWKLGQENEPDFVELHVEAPEAGAEPIEIVLENGRVVRVPASFDEAALARTLSVAEAT